MAKEVKRVGCESIHEDSPIFNMDFASDGINWFKGFCQKLEVSCNECVDACSKYINTAGEHIKKIYAEVCERDEPCDEDMQDSDSFSNQSVIEAVSNESSVQLPKNCAQEKESDCNQMQSTTSLPEDSSFLPPSSECKEEPVLTEGNTGENCTESTESEKCIQSLAEVKGEDCEEVAEGKEDYTTSKSDVLNHNSSVEGHDAMKIYDSWLDVDEGEIALISQRTGKNLSFKKKLKNVFMSHKVHNQTHDVTTSGKQCEDTGCTLSVVPCSCDLYLNKSSEDTLESEWEVL